MTRFTPPVTVLLAVPAWLEVRNLSWIRPATYRERREFIESLSPAALRWDSPEALYRKLTASRHPRYVLVSLLDGAPKCILRRAAEKIRLRDICG